MDPVRWLMEEEADVSIRYGAARDLLDWPERKLEPLRRRIGEEGWGARYLEVRGENGHWGQGYYSPKWISTHYTLLELRNLELPRDNPAARDAVALSLRQFRLYPDQRVSHAGSGHSRTRRERGAVTSDVCINGMFLHFACWFGAPPAALEPVVDFLLGERMPDGGFNCQSTRRTAHPVHSSLHTTLSVLEGIETYRSCGYTYKLHELLDAAETSRAFILVHRFFRSDHTGEVISPHFMKLSCPWRWHYDILRALDYFRASGQPYDERMRDALEVLRDARRPDGTWHVGLRFPGEEHFRMEPARGPSRYLTLRALRVLRAYGCGLEGVIDNGGAK